VCVCELTCLYKNKKDEEVGMCLIISGIDLLRFY
jgi:hypothetical protein